jgi:hypothetical protein
LYHHRIWLTCATATRRFLIFQNPVAQVYAVVDGSLSSLNPTARFTLKYSRLGQL